MKCSARRGLIAALVILTAGSLPTLAGPAQASFPGVNGWIAFVTDRDSPVGGPTNDEVYVIDESGTSKRLTNHPAVDGAGAVSPNGKEVAFISNRNDAAHPNPEGDFEIYMMDVNDDDGDGNGDNLRRITNDATHADAPAWSPDGRKIAFNCLLAALVDVCVMDAEGSESPVNLTSDSPARDGEPAFSPDGTKIAFHSRRLGGPNHIFMMNADGSDKTRITFSVRGNIDAEFSPDGTMLTFASDRDGDADIYVMKAEPESALNVPVNLTDASPVFERWPTWSPDGTKIAFWSGSGQGFGPDAEIYLIDPDGTNLTNLTNTWGGDAFPDWGPARTKGPQQR